MQALDQSALWGTHISTACQRAVELSERTGEPVEFEFNGIRIEVPLAPDSTASERAEAAVTYFTDECDRRHREYLASPEYAKAKAESEERQRKREEDLSAALADAPESMSLADPEMWAEGLAKNQDDYGSAVYRYAERWARIMEGRIAKGASVAECAKEASHLADSEGITGFMHGCAVWTLAHCWKHGEELRRWHNLDTQTGSEGERANESGGVLNPAILSIG